MIFFKFNCSFQLTFFTGFRKNIKEFSTKLNINIPDTNDLLPAFTHESYVIANADKLSGPHECNEKLAFLGEALCIVLIVIKYWQETISLVLKDHHFTSTL